MMSSITVMLRGSNSSAGPMAVSGYLELVVVTVVHCFSASDIATSRGTVCSPNPDPGNPVAREMRQQASASFSSEKPISRLRFAFHYHHTCAMTTAPGSFPPLEEPCCALAVVACHSFQFLARKFTMPSMILLYCCRLGTSNGSCCPATFYNFGRIAASTEPIFPLLQTSNALEQHP